MNKYTKISSILLGIIVLAFSQYKEYVMIYSQSLPYMEQYESDQPNEDHTGRIQKENRNKEIDELNSEDGNQTDQGNNEQSLKLSAVGAALLDADSNRVLYEKNGYSELAMASTTKIMTCLIALEQGNLSDVVTVSSYAARMPDVQLNIKAGEQFYLKDLLYSLMLESHNDTAVAIAEHIGGSVEGFAAKMNQKAKELGCKHTQFVTPNGLDAVGHYTTAVELGKIASYAIKNSKFIDITNTPSWEFKEIVSGKKYAVMNKNRFLYLMDGAIGVKTGFTNNAGYCFVGAVKRGERTFVSVVLGSGWPPHKTYKWNDTTKLMNYGLDHYQRKEEINKQIVLPEIEVRGGTSHYADIYSNLKLSLLMREDEKLSVTYSVPDSLEAPINEGQQVGVLNVYIDQEKYMSVPIYTSETVRRADVKFYINKLLEEYFGK